MTKRKNKIPGKKKNDPIDKIGSTPTYEVSLRAALKIYARCRTIGPRGITVKALVEAFEQYAKNIKNI